MIAMSFFDDIRRSAATGVRYGYSIVLFGGGSAYISGITRVLGIDPRRMEFASEKRVIAVEGEELKMESLEGGCAIVRGRIMRAGEEW